MLQVNKDMIKNEFLKKNSLRTTSQSTDSNNELQYIGPYLFHKSYAMNIVDEGPVKKNTKKELKGIVKGKRIKRYSRMKKTELIQSTE